MQQWPPFITTSKLAKEMHLAIVNRTVTLCHNKTHYNFPDFWTKSSVRRFQIHHHAPGYVFSGTSLRKEPRLPINLFDALIPQRNNIQKPKQSSEISGRKHMPKCCPHARKLASRSPKQRVESVVAAANCLVRRHLTIWLDTMLQAEQLPASIADLHTWPNLS